MKYAIKLDDLYSNNIEYLLNSIGQTYTKPSRYSLKTVRQILIIAKFKQLYSDINKTIVPIHI